MNEVNQRAPELRFRDEDGNGFPAWRTETLGAIAKFSKGKGISKADIDSEGDLECIRYGELYTAYGEVIDEVYSRTSLPAAELVLSKSNDVIIPASGETQLDIATAACVLRDGIALGGDLNIIRTSENGVFLSYYLNSKKRYEIAALAQGVSVVHLYAGQLNTLKIDFPSKEEQEKIAGFLAAVDEEIENLEAQLEAIRIFKKGVVQGLFATSRVADESQTSRRRVADESQTSRRRVADESQTSRRRVADESQTSRRRVADESQTSRRRVADESQ